MSNCVTTRFESSRESFESLSGRYFTSGASPITTPAACTESSRRSPSSARAVSTISFASGSLSYASRSSGDSFSASSIGKSRPMTLGGYILQSRSPTPAGNPSTRAASRMPCFPLIVWNVMICATWSEPYL